MVEFLLDNPWVLLAAVVVGFVLWADHKLKDKTRDMIGGALQEFTQNENDRGLMVYFPPNLKGNSGEVRAAAEDYTQSVQAFFTHRTWPFWATLVVLALVGGAVLAFLVWAGVI
jgi:hypothetical protein